jgi:hypothetical protein
MTAAEAFELVTQGGASDFEAAVAICAELGPYCLIGGLAVNCYVEPVYTLDADLVIVSKALESVNARLVQSGFAVERFPHSWNAHRGDSDLRLQFTLDARYQSFLPRAVEKTVLGIPVRVAGLEDIVQGKLWAWADPQRRLTKRKKDELDLLRLAEAFPGLAAQYPSELRSQFG